MSRQNVNKTSFDKTTLKPGKNARGAADHSSQKRKKPFVEPELREYPSLKNVTLLSMPGAQGATMFP